MNETHHSVAYNVSADKRTTNAQWSVFSSQSQNFKLDQINFAAYGVFLADLCFFINQQLFLQKTKTLYLNPKCLFGIGIWIWAAKK